MLYKKRLRRQDFEYDNVDLFSSVKQGVNDAKWIQSYMSILCTFRGGNGCEAITAR